MNPGYGGTGFRPNTMALSREKKKVVLYGRQLQFIAVRMRIAGVRMCVCVCAQCTDCVVIIPTNLLREKLFQVSARFRIH